MKYGIFLDRFSANLLLNAFLLEKKYKGKIRLSPQSRMSLDDVEAAHVCIDLMLQDNDDDPLTRALGLNACYNFYSNATDEDFKAATVEDDDEDIVCAHAGHDGVLRSAVRR